MTRARSLTSLFLFLSGCAPSPPGAEDTGGTAAASTTTGAPDIPTSGASTSTVTSAGTATTSDETVDPDAGSDDDVGFIAKPDLDPDECDLWNQDCPRGEKCAPVASGPNNTWDTSRCVPVVEDPQQVGDPCTAELQLNGLDDCDVGMVCLHDQGDTQGVCFAMCTVGPEDPTCTDPAFICTTLTDAFYNFCRPLCDPLAQDCEDGEMCVQYWTDEGYICVTDASGEGGQLHDPCMFANSCDPGLLCLDADADAADECDPQADGCCEPYCDLGEPDPCPGAGQTCHPVFPDDPPQDLEHVGFCSL